MGSSIYTAILQNAGLSWVFSSLDLVEDQDYTAVCDGVEIAMASSSLTTERAGGRGMTKDGPGAGGKEREPDSERF